MGSYSNLADVSESGEMPVSTATSAVNYRRRRQPPLTSNWQEMRSEDQRMVFILLTVGMFIVLLVGALLKQGSDRLVVETAGLADNRAGLFDVEAAVPAGSGLLSPVFTREVHYWDADIFRWAGLFDLDPNMVATVMQIESCGDPEALSHAGATGLFQVMPFHFQSGENMFDPNTNALRGMNYLAERLVQTQGDAGLAFAGYNGGHVAAAGDWNSWSNETQRYFRWSTGIFADAQAGLEDSPTLREWLAAGGRSLCNQAASRLGLR